MLVDLIRNMEILELIDKIVNILWPIVSIVISIVALHRCDEIIKIVGNINNKEIA